MRARKVIALLSLLDKTTGRNVQRCPASACRVLDCKKLTGTLGGRLGDSLALYTSLASL